jgi:hypothetical protein
VKILHRRIDPWAKLAPRRKDGAYASQLCRAPSLRICELNLGVKMAPTEVKKLPSAVEVVTQHNAEVSWQIMWKNSSVPWNRYDGDCIVLKPMSIFDWTEQINHPTCYHFMSNHWVANDIMTTGKQAWTHVCYAAL